MGVVLICSGVPVPGLPGKQQLCLLPILVPTPGTWPTGDAGFVRLELRPSGLLISDGRDGAREVGAGGG